MPTAALAEIGSSTSSAPVKPRSNPDPIRPLKRNDDDEAGSPPSRPARRPKLQHASALGQESLFNPLRGCRLNVPEVGSILAIMRDNCRRRLHLPPLQWTAEHVKLLGCSFSAQEVPQGQKLHRFTSSRLRPPRHGDDAPKTPFTPLDFAILAAKSLSRPSILEARTAAASDILAACKFQSTGMSSPSFYFDGDRYNAQLPAPALFTSESRTPSLAYMNLDTLQPMRREHLLSRFRPCFYDYRKKQARANVPVSRQIRNMVRQLQPENELEDPYVVAVLIALAQEQQYWAQKQLAKSPTPGAQASTGVDLPCDMASGQLQSLPTSFKVHVLAMPRMAARHLYLYTACIPASFLDKFDQPWKASPSPSVTIAYYALQLQPPKSLPRRLLLLYVRRWSNYYHKSLTPSSPLSQ